MENTQTSELVTIRDNEKAVTTSRIIANVFGRNHRDVLRDIKNLECSDEFRERNFAPSSYTSIQGKELPMFILDRDGFIRLVMGFTGEKAAEYKEEFIRQFSRMEKMLTSDEFILLRASQIQSRMIDTLRLSLSRKDEVIALQKTELKLTAPIVQYCQEVLQAEGDMTTTIIAKELGTNAQVLNKILYAVGLQFRQGSTWVLYAKHDNKGYTKTRTTVFIGHDGKDRTSHLTTWTEKGRKVVHELYKVYQTNQTKALQPQAN